ncbi:MAG: ribosome-associated translation inhibitor RaiA [Chitinivibrionales bacterium]|nr:ribosome-associated translation inhibitor RaiA [Chitinivibrionales bacterium]
MEIKFTSRHDTASKSFKKMVEEELTKLEKYHDKITSCHVITDNEHIDQKVELIVNMQNHTVKAEAKADKLAKALDGAISKAERQLKKINQKLKNHKAEKLVVTPLQAEADDEDEFTEY